MSFFSRILGLSATAPPADPGCWSHEGGRVTVDLSRAAELQKPGGALRLEGGGLPQRVLVVRGDDGACHALVNSCAHMGRRLDPLDGGRVRCCSVGKSTFTLNGELLGGSAKEGLHALPCGEADGKLTVTFS